MAPITTHLPLFGGSRAWSANDWTSSDDRVRGGSSHSEMTCSPSSLIARFHGYLDIKALGGAGFASQRTTGEHRAWDLSRYDGIELVVDRADDKIYTLTLKDELLPKRPDGRERSSLSWEADFRVEGRKSIVLKWGDFRPTYRGKICDGAEPLDLRNIRRIGIMIRSFFGDQEGAFSLNLLSIAAVRTERYLDEPTVEDEDAYMDEKTSVVRARRRRWVAWLASCLGVRHQ